MAITQEIFLCLFFPSLFPINIFLGKVFLLAKMETYFSHESIFRGGNRMNSEITKFHTCYYSLQKQTHCVFMSMPSPYKRGSRHESKVVCNSFSCYCLPPHEALRVIWPVSFTPYPVGVTEILLTPTLKQ